MTRLQLSNIKMQFERYVESFAVNGEGLPVPLNLKYKHCQNVSAEARYLSAELEWSTSEQNLSEATGLLHDTGRFSQFDEFGTFSDATSVDHGERGAVVVEHAGWLEGLASKDSHAILSGIRYHNRLSIPDNIRDAALATLRLVRDADKLDIIQIVLDAVDRDGFRDLPSMLPNVT